MAHDLLPPQRVAFSSRYEHIFDSGTVRGKLDKPISSYVRYYEGERLVKEEISGGARIVERARTFECDDQGRIEKELRDIDPDDGEIDEGTLFRYDDQGRLSSRFCYQITRDSSCDRSEKATCIAWDDAGNPLEDAADDYGTFHTYEYDSFDYSCW